MSIPLRLTVLPPFGRNVGSRKLGTPWERMQFAFAIAASRSLSLAGDPCPAPGGWSGAHASWADWNAGDCVSTPDRLMPFGPGSGKLEIPCARMQSAKATAVLDAGPAA